MYVVDGPESNDLAIPDDRLRLPLGGHASPAELGPASQLHPRAMARIGASQLPTGQEGGLATVQLRVSGIYRKEPDQICQLLFHFDLERPGGVEEEANEQWTLDDNMKHPKAFLV